MDFRILLFIGISISDLPKFLFPRQAPTSERKSNSLLRSIWRVRPRILAIRTHSGIWIPVNRSVLESAASIDGSYIASFNSPSLHSIPFVLVLILSTPWRNLFSRPQLWTTPWKPQLPRHSMWSLSDGALLFLVLIFSQRINSLSASKSTTEICWNLKTEWRSALSAQSIDGGL